MVCVSPLYRKSGDFALEFLSVHKEFYLFSQRMRVAYYYTLKGGVHHVFVQQGCYDRFFFLGKCVRVYFFFCLRVSVCTHCVVVCVQQACYDGFRFFEFKCVCECMFGCLCVCVYTRCLCSWAAVIKF